jgi:hypothetical protein
MWAALSEERKFRNQVDKTKSAPLHPVMKSTMLIPGVVAFLLISIAAAQDSKPEKSPAAESPGETTPHHPDEISELLQEWAPPTDEPHASSSGDARGFLGHYLSTKPLSEVWTHYATKLGMTSPKEELRYQANCYTEQFPKAGPRRSDGHASLTIKNIQFPGQTERESTLIRREPNGKVITVFLASQGEQTFVSVMILPALR